jgi:C1A family cysteine protease
MEGLISQSVPSSLSTRQKLAISLSGILLVSAVVVLSSSKSPAFLSAIEVEEQEFQSYLSLFSKSYPSSQLGFRRAVFQSNCAKIREYNSENSDVILSVNKFADLTHEEFKAIYTSEHPASSNNNFAQQEENFEAPPPAVDWRDKGAVTDVADQKNCTAGWAFAAAGAVEAAWQLAGNPLEDLSVQELLDCVTIRTSNGCQGGLVSDALLFVQMNNLTSCSGLAESKLTPK